MRILFAGLQFCTRHGRWILVASLLVGLASPALAGWVKPHIDILIALLLFTACLRIGPKAMLGVAGDIRTSLAIIVLLQVLLPISVAILVVMINIDTPLVIALILLTSAPSLSGSPHLVMLMGFEPAGALRLLVLGTALLPLTIVPVFMLVPEFGTLSDVIVASLWLLAIILAAACMAFVIRLTLLKEPSNAVIKQIDGVSTVLLAVTVVGLMAAIGEQFAIDPGYVLITLVVATGANILLQILSAVILASTGQKSILVPVSIVAGNRNIALFLTALPAATTQPLLLFIACYQVPMYLTPIIMRPFYRRLMKGHENQG